MIGITDPESAISAVLGLLICLGAVYIFVGFKPYKNPKDSELGITLAFSLLLFFLSALMLKVAATANLSVEDQELFGYMLCGVLAAGPLMMTWAEIGGKVLAVGTLGFKCCYCLVRAVLAAREKRKKKKEDEEKAKRGDTGDAGETKEGVMDAETKEDTGVNDKAKKDRNLKAVDDGDGGGRNRDRSYSRSDSSYSSNSSYSDSGSTSGSGGSGSAGESEEEESEEESESESESEEDEDEREGEEEEEEEGFEDDTQVCLS